jgi:hypothetical protein
MDRITEGSRREVERRWPCDAADAKEIAAEHSKIFTRGSSSWRSSSLQRGVGSSAGIAFAPYAARRLAASPLLSPDSICTLSDLATSSASRACACSASSISSSERSAVVADPDLCCACTRVPLSAHSEQKAERAMEALE